MFVATITFTLPTKRTKKLSQSFSSERECNQWLDAKIKQAMRMNYTNIAGAYTAL